MPNSHPHPPGSDPAEPIASHVVVDAANVVGARPDGWWKDRRGAAERLLTALAAAAGGAVRELAGAHVAVVLEGKARDAAPEGLAGLELIRAERDGDATVVATVRQLVAATDPGGAAPTVLVVTSDRELRGLVGELGAQVRGAGWLRDRIDDIAAR